MTAILKEEPAALASGIDTTAAGLPPGPRAPRLALPREEPGRALPVGARPRLRARGRVDDVEQPGLSRPRERPPGVVAARAASRLARRGRARRSAGDEVARRAGADRAAAHPRAHLLRPGPRPRGLPRRPPGGVLFHARRRLADLDQAAPGRRRGPAHGGPGPLPALLARRRRACSSSGRKARRRSRLSHRTRRAASRASWRRTPTWPTGCPTARTIAFLRLRRAARSAERARRRGAGLGGRSARARERPRAGCSTRPRAARSPACASRRTAARWA